MRPKDITHGLLIILFILPAITFSADEAEEESTQTPDLTTEDAAQTDNTEAVQEKKTTTPREVIPRSFTPSQQIRIQTLTEQISQRTPNEIETLESQGETFLALYREAQGNDTQGCIILIHGNNEHPDWPRVIKPIRMSMTQNSWCTLSIEVPDNMTKEAITVPTEPASEETTEGEIKLPNEESVFARIEASIAFTSDKGVPNVSLLGYGTGASYAIKYSINNNLSSGALLLVSASMPNKMSPFPIAQLLKNSQQAVLDYYIQPNKFDKQFADARYLAMSQRENQVPLYTQIKASSNTQYDINSNQLIQRVRGFLKQNTQQREQHKQLPSTQKALFYSSPIESGN